MTTKKEALLDVTPLEFGKYKGTTPEQIAEFDPSYIIWLYETVKPRKCSRSLYLACEQDEEDDFCGLGPDEF